MKIRHAFWAMTILWSLSSVAQQNLTPPFISGGILHSFERVSSLDTCSADTVFYPWSKTTSTLGIAMNVPSEFYGYAEYYEAPQEITVHGLTFYGGVNNTDPLDSAVITCGIYSANPDSTPNVLLTSVNVTVGNTYNPMFPDQMKVAVDFPSPIAINGPYLVSLQTNTLSNLGILCNDYNNGDGQQENLGFWRWTSDATWYASQEFFAWDVDFLVLPHVTYETWASYQTSTNALCANDSICMSLDSVAPIYYSRMYNQNALSGNAEAGFAWVWGDGSTNGAFDDTCHAYAAEGTFGAQLALNLVGWNSNCLLNVTDSIFVNSAPILAFSNAINDLTVDFSETISNQADSIWWDYGDGNTETGSMATHQYSNYGTYTVCLFGANSCGIDSICQAVQVTCVAPDAIFNTAEDSSGVAFTDVSTGNNITDWLWDFGDGNTSTMQNPNHQYAAPGVYTVCLIVTDACTSDTTCSNLSVFGVGIDALGLKEEIGLFPNPATHTLHLAVHLVKSAPLQLEVSDLTGRLLESKYLSAAHSFQEKLDVSRYDTGSYIIRMSNENGTYTRTFIKQ